MAATKPLVNIVVITYNQEKYIEQALDSIVEQVTNFPFEIIISDDRSTDRTPEIIRGYEKKFPDIIKFTPQPKNLGAQKNFVFALQQTHAKYVALCDGDDFWNDKTKLQRQVDFLEANPDYAISFHPVTVFFEGSQEPSTTYPDSADKAKFNLEGLLKSNFIQTNSVVYRRKSYDNIPIGIIPGDWYLHLYHAQYGKIGFINRVMSSYRRHPGGLWWETTHQDSDNIWKKHGAGHLALYAELLKLYGDKVESRQVIDKHIEGTVNILSRIDGSDRTKLMEEFTEKFPELSISLFLSLSRTTYKNSKPLEKIEAHEQLETKLHEALHTVQNLQQEKEQILNSKTYKVGNKLAKISRSIRRIK